MPDTSVNPRLLDVLDEFGLAQCVSEPTREDQHIDIVAADNNVPVNSVRDLESSYISDDGLFVADLPRPSSIWQTIV